MGQPYCCHSVVACTAVLQYVQQLISTQDRSNLHLMLCGTVSLAHAFQTGLQFILMLCIATPRAPAFQSRLECVYKLVTFELMALTMPAPNAQGRRTCCKAVVD